MFPLGRQQRVMLALELFVGFVLIGLLALNAMRRMDYLGDDTGQYIRMTDASRTAYVAKNLAEGRGYTTNDLPAALVDFYDTKGKLHDKNWVNADRFPFGAYATAAIYKVTGTTSWEVGILVYNLIFWIAFLVLLYRTASKIWDDRYAGVFAVTLALLHPYTFVFLYWKDGDMLFLTTACIALLVRYYEAPPARLTRKFAVGLGTLLAFLFLARPNLGVAFLLFIGVSILRRIWVTRRTAGVWGAVKRHAQCELLIPLTVILWCLPFIFHTMSEWGQPLFSANNLYQLPLGTRYGMGTDTWWKYTEPGQLPTFGLLAEKSGDELLAKFTSSWVATIKHVLGSHALELLLACGTFMWLGAKGAGSAEGKTARAFRIVAMAILFAVVANLAILPLYSYQDYSFRHYLAFALPLLWIAAGRALTLLIEHLRPAVSSIWQHARSHTSWYVLGAVVVIGVWNLGSMSQPDVYRMFARTGAFIERHWVGTTLVVGVVLARRWLFRPPWFPRVVALAFTMVYACYRPAVPFKRIQFQFFALDQKVWDSLRERQGIVSSFALQGEVAWNTGRKNIPAPEWPMHVYSFHFNHQLEIEDVYIESGDAMVEGGPFGGAAPGFEGYGRLQHYRSMPGYEVAFHAEAVRGYPKYKIKPISKASTVFKLSDRAALEAMRKTPTTIDLGDDKNAIYTPHGWDRYRTIDGKRVATASNVTRARYEKIEGPWEDSSITFFVDDHVPKAIELELYAPGPGTYDFYWNLDLYAYDRTSERHDHLLGTFVAPAAGWHRARFDVPAKLIKRGLNKLGFRTLAWSPVVSCPTAMSDEGCTNAFFTTGPTMDKHIKGETPRIVRDPTSTAGVEFDVVSLYARELTFVY